MLSFGQFTKGNGEMLNGSGVMDRTIRRASATDSACLGVSQRTFAYGYYFYFYACGAGIEVASRPGS